MQNDENNQKKSNNFFSKYMPKILIVSGIIFVISLLLMPILTIYQHWRFERYGWQIESIPKAESAIHLAVGNDNRVWLGVDDQVYVSDADKWEPELVYEFIGLDKENIIRHFTLDNENRLWVMPKVGELKVISGTNILSGYELLNSGRSNSIYTSEPIFGPNNEIAIIKNDTVDIYRGGEVETLAFPNSSNRPDMAFGPGGEMFVAEGNVTMIYDGHNWVTFDHDFLTGGVAVFDQANDKWIASERECCNLTIFDYVDGRYETIEIPYSSFRFTSINALSFDQQGRLWVGFENFSSPKNNVIGVWENDEWQFYSLFDMMEPILDLFAPATSLKLDSNNRLWSVAGSNIARLDLQDSLPPSASLPLGAYSKIINYVILALSGVTVGILLCVMLWRNWIIQNEVSWSRQESDILLKAVLVTVITWPIAFFLAGGGHGTYIPFFLLYPVSVFAFSLGGFQIIIYGFLLAIGNMKSKRKETLKVLIIIHIFLVLLAFGLFYSR